jgi:DNA glycosylase AlkZ-like
MTTRAQVLRYRTVVQALDGGTPVDGVLRLGLQDTPAGSARLGLAARDAGPRDDLALALTLRGAPHLHRRADLAALRATLMPRDTAELATWLGGYGATLVDAGVDGPALVGQVADLLRAALPGGTATKGELSGRISPQLPDIARPWCAGCRVHHVTEGLFRLGTLLAGLELVGDGGRGLVFRPGPADVAAEADRRDLARVFLRLVGPAGPADLTAWLSTLPHPAGAALSGALWEALGDELVPVSVDGQRRWMLADTVVDAAVGRTVRLLPPRDPYLLGDRRLVVADPGVAKQVWRALNAPGVLLVDGEVCGIWRQKLSRRRRGPDQQGGALLDLDVRLFGTLAAARRRDVQQEAERVAAARGAAEARLAIH